MQTLLAILIGILFATGVYCLLQRSIVRLAVGIVLISQAANLLVFTAAGLLTGAPPLIESGKKTFETPFADPLPQALVLTAIVIGFGVIAFLLALVYRTHRELGEDDLQAFDQTDRT